MAAAVERAEAAGVAVEVVVVLDRPDEATRTAVASSVAHLLPQAQMLASYFGDQAESRNEAISKASGDLVALIDGDDLIGESWLSEASKALESWGPRVVVHPSVCLMFEDQPMHPPVAWIIQDSRSRDFNFSMLAQQNAWPACVALYRSTALEFPFVATPNEEGFAAEDLHWNLTLLGAGVHHAPVPQTSYFYRIRGHQSNLRKGRPIRPVAVLRDSSLLRSLGRFEVSGKKPAVPVPLVKRKWFMSAVYEVLDLMKLLEDRLAPRRAKRRRDRDAATSRVAIASEAWFLKAVDAAARIEPRLATGMGHSYAMHQVTNQADPFSDLYWEFVDYLGSELDSLVIAEDDAHLPHGEMGVTMVTTASGSGRVATLGQKLAHLSDPHFSADRLIAVIVTQLTPATLKIHASSLAWRAMLRWGLAMSQSSEISVVISASDLRDDRYFLPEEVLRIREIVPFLSAIVVENQAMASILTEIYGVDENLVSVGIGEAG